MYREKEINEEEILKNAFKPKTWQEIKTHDSWEIFQILSEFVQGFDKLASIGPCNNFWVCKGKTRLSSL